MRFCDRKITRWCPGHTPWEKFSDCLVESLMYADADESTGTVDWHVWAGLYLVEEAESITGRNGWSVDIPAGTYAVITENDHGRVTWSDYPTAEQAQEAFDQIDQAYGLWRAGQDMREQEIMIMSGRIGR